MENKFKRFLSLLLALVMVIGMMPLNHAHAAVTVDEATNTINMQVGDSHTFELDGDKSGSYDGGNVATVSATFTPQLTEYTVANTTTDATLETGKYVLQNTRVNKFLESTSEGGKLWCAASVGTAEVWTITAVEGGYTMKTAAGQYMTFTGSGNDSTSSLTDTNTVLSFTWMEGTSTWQIGCNGTYLNSFDSLQKAGGYHVSGDAGSQWRLYKVTDEQQAYSWTLGSQITEAPLADGYYIFENTRSSKLVSNKWSHTNDGGSGTGFGLKQDGTKDGFSTHNVWKVTAVDGGYNVADIRGWYLEIATGKGYTNPATQIITIGKNSTTYSDKWQIAQSNVHLNGWGGQSNTFAGWSDVDGGASQFHVYEVTATPLGTTTVTIQAVGAGDTTVTIGDTEYTIHVTTTHTHNYVETVTQEATCIATGVKTLTCSCGNTQTQEIAVDSNNHVNTTTTPAVLPTLNAAGTAAVVYCNDCQTTVSGGEVLAQLTAKNAQPMMDSWGDKGIVALSECEYTLSGTEQGAYSLCHGGNYYVKPAADTNARPQQNAPFAELTLEIVDGKLRISTGSNHLHVHLAGTAHTESGANPWWNKCSSYHADAWNGSHDFYLMKANPNSTNANIPGYEQVTTLTDGESYLIAFANKDNEWFVMYPSTENVSLAKIVAAEVTHEHEYTTTTQAATCTTTGLKTDTCTGCGHVHTEVIPVDESAHTPGTHAQEDVVAPSCYQDGSYNTVTRCTVCTAIISSVPGTTPATGNHTWNEGEVTTAPGCESAGEKTYTCTVDGCGETKTEAVSATSHAWGEWTVETPSTCIAYGTEKRVCANDGTHIETRTIEEYAAHTWDAGVYTKPTVEANGYTTYTCTVVGCGATNIVIAEGTQLTAVAQVNGVNYATLAEAVAEANDGDTVTLLNNATGAGVVIDKSITIDLNNHTYTINSPVGSTGTETNGFQIKSGNDVTIQNGKLEVAAEYADKFYMLIQNYANLTVANVTLDGTNLDKRIGIDNYSYVLSNNSGNVTITGTTSITANNDGGDYAFALDACKYGSYAAPTVTVNTTGTIAGNIEVTGGNLDVRAATITGDLVYGSGTVTKADDVTLAAPADYKWDNGTLTAKTYVAQVGETKYESLAVAVAEAPAGSEVKLLSNTNGDGIVIDKDITIDLAGFTYTIDGTLVGSANTQSNGFQIKSGNTVTIKNGDIVMDEGAVRGHDGQTGRNFVIQNYANLTLENVDITGNNETTYVVSINSGDVAITGTTSITAPEGAVAFDVYDYSSAGYAVPTVNVSTTGTITGEIEVSKTATLAISSGTYTVALEESWCAEGFMPTEVEGGYGVAECDTYTWYDENDNALYTKKVAKGAGAPDANTYDVPAKEGFTGSWTTVDGGYKASYTEIVVEDKVTLVGYEAVYDAEIAMRVCIDIPDSMVNNVSVVMTKAGNWGEVTKTFSGDTLVYNDAKGGYVVEMGVASGEMARAITVKVLEGETELMLYGSEGELGTSWTSTIKDYVKAMMNSNYGQDNKNAAAAMIVYGGYAQKFFGVDADEPAYDVLTELGIALPDLSTVTLDDVDAYKTTQNSVKNGIRASSLEAFLDSSTYLRVSFVLDEGESIDNYSFALTYPVDGQEATMSLEPVYNAQSGKYYVDIPDIVAAYLDYNYTITATNNQTQQAYTVTTSVLAWVRLVMKNTNSSVDRVNMVKALYLYNQAVNTLFA